MPDYRRNRVPGGTYFFTVNLLERRRQLLVEMSMRYARRYARYVTRCRFTLMRGWCCRIICIACGRYRPVTPIIRGGGRRSRRHLPRLCRGDELLSDVRRANHERGIWQRRFWEHTIRDDRDYAAHMDYICFNPVKHGWVERVVDWPYSSFHRLVRAGVYPVDWGGVSGGEIEGAFGERGSD